MPLAMACSCLILAALFFGSVSLLLPGLQFPGGLEIQWSGTKVEGRVQKAGKTAEYESGSLVHCSLAHVF